MLIESLDRDAWRPHLLLVRGAAGTPLAQRAAELDVPVHMTQAMPLGTKGARRVPSLMRWLARHRPDVFHAHLTGPLSAKWALVAAVAARIPAIVATLQVVPPFELTRSSAIQLRALGRGVDRYIAVSRDIASYLVEKLGVPGHKVEVVYNAVRSERFAGASRAQLEGLPAAAEPRTIVLTCARLDRQKGHEVLLAAAAEVPNAVFLVAGDGPERSELEQLAARLGVEGRVVFLGYRDDVPELLAACDVFALPTRYEGSSLALLEAMAAGRAIISSDVPGNDELIENGTSGVLVPPDDPQALAQALNGLIADPALRRSLAEHGRSRAHEFRPEAMAQRVAQVYEELLGDGADG